MHYTEDGKYEEIRSLIYDYLKEYSLPKIACLTNYAPDQYTKDYLVEYFNYICYCASSKSQRKAILHDRYLLAIGKTPFDICINTPFSCLQDRPYGYVSLKMDNKAAALELIKNTSNNKDDINIDYPILLRMKGLYVGFEEGLPENCILEKRLGETDVVFRIKS
jgi:hypothetical protein